MRTSREACERGIAPSSTDFIPFLPDQTTVKHVRPRPTPEFTRYHHGYAVGNGAGMR
jgi:hypothetical protein